jgi:hypothetical protein
MESDKVYMLFTRTRTGEYTEKVRLLGDLYFCKTVLNAMMRTSSRNVRGEIIEGDREYIMDFRVKPIAKFKLTEDNQFVEDN